ncbi:hypothetical protein [Amycolatopsis vastitatis]|uniref:Uncharacterized protein n=1 Tax=Amycolatopsis vastitatis TaxID=1905142 RepID=A0A229SJQ9_9PSEU|nr:hypothetical protein [Amycolatopsis vastitatis]OXM59142.1 hypothetical protein CF165_49230 [Amycolatopsis vastitatis]
MQNQGGVAADAAITDNERRIRWRFNCDWNGTSGYDHPLSFLAMYVLEAEIDRALKGSAPEEIMLIEGSSAAELRVTIAGRDETTGLGFDAVFSPYNGLSPLYTKQQIGTECLFDIGVDTPLGTVWYPQFVGNITTIDIDRSTGEVHIAALDRVEKLRRPVVLAPWAVSDYWNNLGRITAQQADTACFIETCLQQCDTSATRYRPTTRAELDVPDGSLDGVGVFVPANGGINPTVGWLDNAPSITYPLDGVPMYQASAQPHPASPDQSIKAMAFAAMGTNGDGDFTKYWVANRDLTRAEGSHFLGLVLSTALGFPNSTYYVTAPETVLYEYRAGGNYVFRIHLEANQVWLEVYNENTARFSTTARVTIPSGQESVEVYATVMISQGDGIKAYIRAGVNNSGYTTIGPNFDPNTYPFDPLQGLLLVRHRVAMFDIAYAYRNLYQATLAPETNLWRQARYAAVLDRGANTLSFNPGVNGTDAWDVITKLAAAEFGSVFWDENGVFRFWNYATVRAKQDRIVRTVSLDTLRGLEITNSLDSVRNIYSVSASKRTASAGRIYEAQSVDQFIIPGSTQRDFILYVDDVQFAEPRRLPRHTTIPLGTPTGNQFLQWSDQWSHHGYVMQLLYPEGWHEPNFVNVELDVYAFFNNDGMLVLRINNPWAETARLAVGNGDGSAVQNDNRPTLRIDGTQIIKGSDQTFRTADAGSVAKYGPRNYEATGEWYQQSYNDNGLLTVLLPRTAKPIPTTQQVSMPGDPRLQLADTLALDDPDGVGSALRLQIFGINRKLTRDSGLVDTLSVELIRPPGLGIWDSAPYGRWDQSLIWN